MPKKSKGTQSQSGGTAKTKKRTATKRVSKRTPRAAQGAKAAAKAEGKLRIRQVRSAIGHAETFRRTLRALGLRHHQDEVVVSDNPSLRGMVHQVHHLVRITVEEA